MAESVSPSLTVTVVTLAAGAAARCGLAAPLPPGITSFCPMVIRPSGVRWLAEIRLSTDTPKRCPIAESVSPCATTTLVAEAGGLDAAGVGGEAGAGADAAAGAALGVGGGPDGPTSVAST